MQRGQRQPAVAVLSTVLILMAICWPRQCGRSPLLFFSGHPQPATATVAAATHPRGASRNVASYSLSACVMLVGRVGLSRCSGGLLNDCTYSRLLLDRVKETESITMARFSLVRPRSIDCATTCCHRCLRRAPLPRARECQLDLSTPTVIGS
jgi:hypothetical protein